jgi:CheY-like chemotaxis protein
MDKFEKKQVLLVEDNARLRGTVREILRWQGYHVHEAADRQRRSRCLRPRSQTSS